MLAPALANLAAGQTTLDDCVADGARAARGLYPAGRVHSEGYGRVTVNGQDLSSLEGTLLKEGDAHAVDLHVAQAFVTVDYAGLPAALLGRDARTQVQQHAAPLDLTTSTHEGAHRMSLVFTGHIRVLPAESFECKSVRTAGGLVHGSATWVVLDGLGTATTNVDDTITEPWGWGANIDVAPGNMQNA